MDNNKIHSDIKDCLRERGHTDQDIGAMSPDEAFDEYCEWNGLIKWGSDLRRVMKNLSEANADQ